MKTFDDLKFDVHPNLRHADIDGVQSRLDFDNGWGVSVVRSHYTYGGDKGLYELAVFNNGQIHYDNPIANGDVVGYLRPEDITDAMAVIQKFDKVESLDPDYMHKWIVSKTKR